MSDVQNQPKEFIDQFMKEFMEKGDKPLKGFYTGTAYASRINECRDLLFCISKYIQDDFSKQGLSRHFDYSDLYFMSGIYIQVFRDIQLFIDKRMNAHENKNELSHSINGLRYKITQLLHKFDANVAQDIVETIELMLEIEEKFDFRSFVRLSYPTSTTLDCQLKAINSNLNKFWYIFSELNTFSKGLVEVEKLCLEDEPSKKIKGE